jgi:hypothetical protein
MGNTCMHAIIDKKFYLGPKFGILINKKWITISELLHGPLPILETWPPIYRGQERTERDRLKASQVDTHVYF